VSDAEPVGYPKSPATVEADAGGAQDKPSGARRIIHILGALLVAVVLPALLMGALVGRLGVSALFIGLTLGVVGSKIGGTHRMLFVAPMLGVAAGLGAFTAYDWWWAALLASVAATRFPFSIALLKIALGCPCAVNGPPGGPDGSASLQPETVAQCRTSRCGGALTPATGGPFREALGRPRPQEHRA
jgi:hypothetical protein